MNDITTLESAGLTPEEREIIAWFRKLPDNDKANLLKEARTGRSLTAKRVATVRAVQGKTPFG